MEIILPIISYLFGSIIFGEVIAKVKGIDLRKVGSGNVGATNVSRALGKKYGAIVFFLDMLKGLIPTLLAIKIFGIESFATAFTAIFAVLGHMYPVFFGFKGGKGIATAFGVLLAISPKVAILSIILWTLLVLWKRYVSLASLSATYFAFILLLIFRYPFSVLFTAFVLSILITYKHKENIKRLLTGTELKV